MIRYTDGGSRTKHNYMIAKVADVKNTHINIAVTYKLNEVELYVDGYFKRNRYKLGVQCHTGTLNYIETLMEVVLLEHLSMETLNNYNTTIQH